MSQAWDSTSDGGVTTITYLGTFASNELTFSTLCNSSNPLAVEAGTQTVTYTATSTQVSLEFTGGAFPYVETYTKM